MKNFKILIVLVILACVIFTCDLEKIPPLEPKACFTYAILDTACTENCSVQFNSSECSKNFDAFKWDFGDGQTSNDTNPLHVYNERDIYFVSLIAYLGKKSDTVTNTIPLSEKPEANFTFYQMGTTTTVQFTDMSINAETYLWDFGDGDTSTEKDPQHQYDDYGDYNVTLTAWKGELSDSDTQLVELEMEITTFEKSINYQDFDVGRCVKQTIDGGYIITGYTKNSEKGEKDVLFVKTNKSGDTLFTKTFGQFSGKDEIGYSIQQTNDGGFVIVGKQGKFSYFNRIYSSGNIIVEYFHYEAVNYCVQQTFDNGFVFTGYQVHESTNDTNLIIMKVNSDIEEVFKKTFTDIYGVGYSIQQTSDSGFIVTGYIKNTPDDDKNVLLIRTNKAGDLIWQKSFEYSSNNEDVGYSVQQTNDDEYIITGYTGTGNNADIYLIKTDSAGNFQFDKTYDNGGLDIGREVQKTNNGELVITGISRGTQGGQIYLLRTFDNFNEKYWKFFGNPNNDEYGYSVQQTYDNGFIIVGERVYDESNADIYLVKTDEDGNVNK